MGLRMVGCPSKHLRIALIASQIMALTGLHAAGAGESRLRTAELAHDAVIYSGPGDTYYHTTILPKGERVRIVDQDEHGWVRIQPPAGSFSLVPADAFRRRSDGTATVQQDRVVALVGGDTIRNPDAFQVYLSAGEQVQVIDELSYGGRQWYKINPPSGEFRWIRQADLLRGRFGDSTTGAVSSESAGFRAGSETDDGIQLAQFVRQSDQEGTAGSSSDPSKSPSTTPPKSSSSPPKSPSSNPPNSAPSAPPKSPSSGTSGSPPSSRPRPPRETTPSPSPWDRQGGSSPNGSPNAHSASPTNSFSSGSQGSPGLGNWDPYDSSPSLSAGSLGGSTSGFGDAASPQGNAMAFIGDRFGGGTMTVTMPTYYASLGLAGFPNVQIGAGSVVGRTKITENNSPLPRDRVFLDSSYFFDVPILPGGVNVFRMSPGFERTFACGTMSFEARFPFAITADSNIVATNNGAIESDRSQVEMGNVPLIYKALLGSGPTHAVAAGLMVALPTADDLNLSLVNTIDGNTAQRLHIDNAAWHLMPFVGGVLQPCSPLFYEWFVQLDFPTNGNPVMAATTQDGGLQPVGELNDPIFLYVSGGVGYWLFQDPYPGATLSGIAARAELHYNQSLGTGDSLTLPGGFSITDEQDVTSLLNLVAGATFMFDTNSNLTIAYVVPVAGREDLEFAGELRTFFNWYF